jgi:serine protease Do
MRFRSLAGSLGLVVAILFLFLASGALDVRVEWRGPSAGAIDLFGGGEEQEAAEAEKAEPANPFWKEGKPEGGPEQAPAFEVPASFADLAERVSPAVVNIKTVKTVTQGPLRLPQPFEEFFGGPFGSPEREFKQPSLGSGFVISTDGYIVTNNHVVEDVDEITVVFADGAELQAKLVGRDPKTDIALIRCELENGLEALPLGDSDRVRPGDWVVAIGNPYGLEHTVTAGIVSAKGRNIGQGPYDDFIQTDAAINPGNSGGPLLNLAGEVIGINTAINPRANTIGFAVPINMAKEILPQLRATGRVTRGWLGVVIQRVTPELAESLELEDEKGALVSRVDPKGPAATAGLEHGDVIVGFDGKPIVNMEELPRIVAATPVGREVDLEVIRGGKRKHFEVTIGELEEPELAAVAPEGTGPATFGIRAQDLTPDLAERLGVEEDHGVVITEVEPGSPAADAELRPGDVILEVDRGPIAGVAELHSRLGEAGSSALLLVRRGDVTLFVALKRKDVG